MNLIAGSIESAAPAPFALRSDSRVHSLGPPDHDFDKALDRAQRDDTITKAARALTAQALVLPILKELRGGSLAWGPFKASDAEKSFGPMLDTALADRIAASPRLPVAAAIEARLRARERGVG